jgi:outer membrane protein TolC
MTLQRRLANAPLIGAGQLIAGRAITGADLESMSDEDLAEANASDARLAVQADLEMRLAELQAAQARIEIAGTSVVAANEDLRVQQERYRLGASTIVDVLTSQEALNQAEVDVVDARFDYLRAKAQLEALIGRTL